MKKSIAGLLALAGLSCSAQAQVVISAIYGLIIIVIIYTITTINATAAIKTCISS